MIMTNTLHFMRGFFKNLSELIQEVCTNSGFIPGLRYVETLITLVNKILAHERFIVFLTYLNPNMQSKFFPHPQFL